MIAGIGAIGFPFYLLLFFLSTRTDFCVVVLLCIGGISLEYNDVYLTMASEALGNDAPETAPLSVWPQSWPAQ